MASRGTALSRALTFFREGNIDEVRVAFTLAKEIVEGRLHAASQVPPQPARAKRTRKAKSQEAPAGTEGIRHSGGGTHESLADA